MSINAVAVFSVRKLVELKPPTISKCFPTLRTSIKFISCMDPEESTPKIASLAVCLALAIVPKQQAEQLDVQTAVLAGVRVAMIAVVHGLAEVVLGLTLVPEPAGRS